MIALGLGYPLRHCQGTERCPGTAVFFQRHPVRRAGVYSVDAGGAFVPGALLRLMGGDAGIVALGIPYARIFLLFTPFFMCNYIVSAFVRNDGDLSLAMVATLSGSLFNVVFDYIFMFPLGLGLAGARWQRRFRPSSASPFAAATSLKRRTPCNSCGSCPR